MLNAYMIFCFFPPENAESVDLKQLFDQHFSHIYYVFFENFVTIEISLKQKGKNQSKMHDLQFSFFYYILIQLLPYVLILRHCPDFENMSLILIKLLTKSSYIF